MLCKVQERPCKCYLINRFSDSLGTEQSASFYTSCLGTRHFHPEGDQLKGEKKTVSGSLTDFSCSVFMGCFHDKSNIVILRSGKPLHLWVVGEGVSTDLIYRFHKANPE